MMIESGTKIINSKYIESVEIFKADGAYTLTFGMLSGNNLSITTTKEKYNEIHQSLIASWSDNNDDN